ncbi:MAG: hypothetical protein PHH91_07415 [Desulfuromonadaceae bacterium]|nr:hypothetical protein [Desulfuromonadaceae bacterium]
MDTTRKRCKTKTVKRRTKTDKCAMSSVITVRISDEEKERISKIMMTMDIKHYSDVMRMALDMIGPKIDYTQASM